MLMVRSVAGGVDTHADFHVAAAIDSNGGVLGVESFPADPAGYGAPLGWLVGFGPVTRVGVEGTGIVGSRVSPVSCLTPMMPASLSREAAQHLADHL